MPIVTTEPTLLGARCTRQFAAFRAEVEPHLIAGVAQYPLRCALNKCVVSISG